MEIRPGRSLAMLSSQQPYCKDPSTDVATSATEPKFPVYLSMFPHHGRVVIAGANAACATFARFKTVMQTWTFIIDAFAKLVALIDDNKPPDYAGVHELVRGIDKFFDADSDEFFNSFLWNPTSLDSLSTNFRTVMAYSCNLVAKEIGKYLQHIFGGKEDNAATTDDLINRAQNLYKDIHVNGSKFVVLELVPCSESLTLLQKWLQNGQPLD